MQFTTTPLHENTTSKDDINSTMVLFGKIRPLFRTV